MTHAMPSSSWWSIRRRNRVNPIAPVMMNNHDGQAVTASRRAYDSESRIKDSFASTPDGSSSFDFDHSGADASSRYINNLDDLTYSLRRNQVSELYVGWRGCEFLQGPRAGRLLEAAVAGNKSLRCISIGYRHKHQPSLVRLLRAIARSPAAENITHFQLVLKGTEEYGLPEDCIKTLLLKMTNLVLLDLRSLTLYKSKAMMTNGSLIKTQDERNIDACVVTTIVKMYNHNRLKSLKLMDCGICDRAANMLADFLHIRGGIAELSLRGNRRRGSDSLGTLGLRCLCQAPVMDRLDLSLCDLDMNQARSIAEALKKRPWPLRELLLCGNYRMETGGLLALSIAACHDKLVCLNISHCDITDHKACLILQALQVGLGSDTLLREMVMQGKLVSNAQLIAQALSDCLKKNNSLRVLKLGEAAAKHVSSGHLKSIMGAPELNCLMQGLQHNYEMEDLEVDDSLVSRELYYNQSVHDAQRDVSFWLNLNKAGRRILRSSPPADKSESITANKEMKFQGKTMALSNDALQKPKLYTSGIPDDEWFKVVENAGNDVGVVYWLVRQSAERFARNNLG